MAKYLKRSSRIEINRIGMIYIDLIDFLKFIDRVMDFFSRCYRQLD